LAERHAAATSEEMRSRHRSRSSFRTSFRWTQALWLLLAAVVIGFITFSWHRFRPPRVSHSQHVPAPPVAANSTPRAAKEIGPRKDALPEGPIVSEAQPYPRPSRTLLEAQIALDRQGISPGSLDGRLGLQTRLAILAFQRKLNLPPSGSPDSGTLQQLILYYPPLIFYPVTSNDLARLQPLGKTWTAKSQQSALEYESVLELVSEKSHTHPACIRGLNPDVDWTNVAAGATLRIPAISNSTPSVKAAFVRINILEKTLEGFDEATNLLVHFPCSIAQRVEKRPIGLLHVETVAPRPNYTFDPELFPESPEAQQMTGKLVLPPGPNNPVGSVWIGLDKTGYGIHGTPNPEQVGRTESHGCFRLANWNAELLLGYCWIGMPVYVEP